MSSPSSSEFAAGKYVKPNHQLSVDGGARSRFPSSSSRIRWCRNFCAFSQQRRRRNSSPTMGHTHIKIRDAYIYAEGGLGRERGVYSPRLCYTLVERLLRVHQYSSVN
jgi:hypothetical protein